MSQDYIPWRSFKSLWLLSPNRYEIDLSNEVLNIDFGQEATKISKVKVRGRIKYLPIFPVRIHVPGVGRV